MSFGEFLSAYLHFTDKFLISLLLLLANDLVFFVVFGLVKWHWLRAKGVSLEDRRAIFSDRKQSFRLENLLRSYPERTLLVVDGLSRKGKHVAVNIFRLVFLTMILDDPILSTQLLLARGIIELACLFFTRNSNALWGAGGLFFGAMSRIRDGVRGRMNYVVASLMGLAGTVFFTAIMFFYKRLGMPDQAIMHLGQLVYLPLTVGDAMGEIFGSLWGKQKIRVLGIGEINRKSVLGTAAVFFGALLPVSGMLVMARVGFVWFLLAAVVALLSTVVELFSPRSTDNFTIPAANSLFILAFAALFLT